MKLGAKIALCRKRAGLSQEGLAQKLTVSRQAVSRWENGDATPEAEKIVQLSRLFAVSTDFLLLEEREAPENSVQAPPQSAPPEPLPKPTLMNREMAERQRRFRIFFGKCLLFLGLAALLCTLAGAGLYACTLSEWYAAWGRYGTALLRTWLLAPLLIGFGMTVMGCDVLWEEYRRRD